MKRAICALAAAILLTGGLWGCRSNDNGPETTPVPTEAPTEAPTEVPTEAPTEVPTEAPTEAPTEVPEPTQAPMTRYAFKPKVCSVYLEDVFGKTICDAWYNLVDAVMAGEDTFDCPDQHTYDWVMGQFPRKCFPVLTEIIDYAYDRGHSVKDGKASFTYRMPKEQAAKRIEEFSEQIEGILNEALEPDYSPFEICLALYTYFYEHYEYDYDTYNEMQEHFVDYTTTIRLFNTGIGICSEISTAYSYLLMQTGIDATTMMGGDHEWSYVRINGRDYHIDPTFAISDRGSLAYFMMTDGQRDESGFDRDKYIIASTYSKEHPHRDYRADDDTFSPLWDRVFEALYPDENRLRCWQYTEGWEKDHLDFDYTGY